MKTRIIIDSTCDLLPQQQEQVTVVPLTLRFGDQEFIDTVTIDRKTFYEKLVETDEIPTTSQATPDAFIDAFETVKTNQEEAVVITLSANLSGTYQSAMIAAAEYDGIYVVDSGSCAIGSGILTQVAISLANQGVCAKEIAEHLEQIKEKIVIVALVDTLEYLKKGGRISKTAAFAGTVLNIKPVLSIVDGIITPLGKARGSKQGNNLLVQEIEKAGGIDFSKPVLLGYTGLSDALLLKYIEDSKALWENSVDHVPYTVIGSVIGTHGGPGAIGVAFFKQ